METEQTGYTPGPWAHTGRNKVECFDVWCEGIYGRNEDHVVCGFHDDGQPTDADARLIAAAPDLLAALEAIRDARDYCAEHGHYPESTGIGEERWFDDWAADIAQGAINKATQP